jgi:hypothetical protein
MRNTCSGNYRIYLLSYPSQLPYGSGILENNLPGMGWLKYFRFAPYITNSGCLL